MYAPAMTAAVVANAAPSGTQFAGRIGGMRGLIVPFSTDAMAPYATVQMATLTVTSGSGSGSYVDGTTVTVVANAPASGYQFSGWSGDTGMLEDPSAATTTLTIGSSDAAISATYTPVASSASTGTSLGTFSLLAGSASSGNSMVVSYGVSYEGNGLTTYWQGAPGFQVLSMGNSAYELVETTGGRCVTMNGSAVTINACSGAASQMYRLAQQANGSILVQSAQGNCLNAAGSFTVVNAQSCDGSSGEQWQFTGSTPLNLGASTTPTSTGTSIVDSPTVPAGYHLTFDDEFQALSISDTNNNSGARWYTHTVQCCLSDTSNPSTPTYMAGISDGAGRNPYSLVSGGLDIRLQKTDGAWYSGVIATVDGTGNGFAQQYGYFEMKAKFPANAPGTWPAFWLLNSAHLSQNVPAGEIDVVESYMQFPTYVLTTLHDWGASTVIGPHQAQVEDTSDGFHVYGMLWTASTMTFYYDGAVIYSVPTPSIMNQPYYPIIDLGLGGGWPTDQTPQSSDLIVQYLRVYSN